MYFDGMCRWVFFCFKCANGYFIYWTEKLTQNLVFVVQIYFSMLLKLARVLIRGYEVRNECFVEKSILSMKNS